MNKYKNLENLIRSFANYRRIQIMEILGERPDLSLQEIAKAVEANLKTVSEHLRRLSTADMVVKNPMGRLVRHKLTDKGMKVLTFLRNID